MDAFLPVLVNKYPTDLECSPQQKGGHNEKVDPSSCTSSTVNRCLHGLVRSRRSTDGFAITIGNSADRLHLCFALPLGSHLGLHSKKMCVCALRCQLRRSLEIPIKPLALALLGASDLLQH